MQLSNKARSARQQMRTTAEAFESDEGALYITEALKG